MQDENSERSTSFEQGGATKVIRVRQIWESEGNYRLRLIQGNSIAEDIT
jgi:hypothetical protein